MISKCKGMERKKTLNQSFLSMDQNRRQKVFNGGLYVCAEGLDIVKIDKAPLIYSVSYFNLGGLAHEPPRGDATGMDSAVGLLTAFRFFTEDFTVHVQ